MSDLALPLDDATALAPVPADIQAHRWSLPTRLGFRLAFCYLGIYCLFNGNATLFESFPFIGDHMQDWLSSVFFHPAQYLAQHLFHIAPPGDKIHPTGSGDTAINYIAVLLMFVLAVLATAVWSALDRRRPHYQTLAAWLRFLIRLTLGYGMVSYGLAKVFPMQMPLPNITSLAEPLGMHSPMSLLWSFIGANPVYEVICGTAELLGGMLLLFRRTALFGSLLTAFVVTNVLLYNLCFDVPVKLYAAHLLLLALFVVLPDAAALFRFFWLHQDARPTGIWVPPSSRRWFRRTTIGIEIGFTVLALAGGIWEMNTGWQQIRAQQAIPSPLEGAWHIDSATLNHQPHPVLSSEQHAFVEFDLDRRKEVVFQTDRSAKTYFSSEPDHVHHTLKLTRKDNSTFTYTYSQPDPIHLLLTPIGPDAATGSTLALTLASPPEGYPLLHRGFHWISEYPYQR